MLYGGISEETGTDLQRENNGPVSNREAERVLSDPEAVAQLGLDLDGMTRSQQRAAVKQALTAQREQAKTAAPEAESASLPEKNESTVADTAADHATVGTQTAPEAVDAPIRGDSRMFGKAGQTVYAEAVKAARIRGYSEADARSEISGAYIAGAANAAMPKARMLSSEAMTAMYKAGKRDAEVSLKEEKARAQYATVYGEESGLIYDDYVKGLDQKVSTQLNTVAKALGLKVQFADQVKDGDANGEIRDGILYIAKDAENPVRVVFGHEITHRMQELAPEQYRAFRDAAMAAFRDGSVRDLAVGSRILHYAEHDVTLNTEEAMDEIAADFAGQLMENGKLLDDFIEQHRSDRTMLEKLRDAFRELVKKLTGQAKQQAQTVEGKLTAALEAAAQQAGQGQKNTATKGGEARFSIVKDRNGNNRVIIDRDIFKGVPEDKRVETLRHFMMENLRGNEYTTLADAEVISVEQKNKNLQKMWRPGIGMRDEKFNARLSGASHLDELIEASIPVRQDPNKKPDTRPERESVDKRAVTIEIPTWDDNDNLIGSTVWDIEITVPKNKTTGKKTAYDLSRVEKRKNNPHSDRVLLPFKQGVAIDRESFSDMVSETLPIVKAQRKFSENESTDRLSLKGSDRFTQEMLRISAEAQTKGLSQADQETMIRAAVEQIMGELGRYRGKTPVGKGLSVAMEGILPFRKTPANILVRGLEYSPAGLLKSLTYGQCGLDGLFTRARASKEQLHPPI